jgi:hypothetical protein
MPFTINRGLTKMKIKKDALDESLKNLDDLVCMLQEILRDIKSRKKLDIKNRKKLVWNFSQTVLDENFVNLNNHASEVLGNLAVDMAYYVSNPAWRKDDPSYFGDDELEAKITQTLSELGFATGCR